ncbi:MAG TPA: methyltransferase domain-containing protein [Gemmatimonadaceae bacterium]|nr:methyltransferase domain-containing protein [Gemmatimonadaceae bacterium]
MDYDRTNMPAVYDRSRDHGVEWLQRWMDILAAHLRGERVHRILDLGCGTGRFTEGLAGRFDAEVTGIDPSMKMLEQARAKPCTARVRYERASAEALPLADGSVDVVFMSMSFHHFTDPIRAARECRRVLREGGTAFVRTGTREQIPAYPFVPFFPAALPILEEVLPHRGRFHEVFEAAGFQLIAEEMIRQEIATHWMRYADKVAARGDSVLARLGDADFEHGLAALRHHASQAGDGPVAELIDLFAYR